MQSLLSVNAGSSSLKISLYTDIESSSPTLLLTSTITSITAPPAKFTFRPTANNDNGIRTQEDVPFDSIVDHSSAFFHFLDALSSEASFDKASIVYICHRVVHGGDYDRPVEINEQSYNYIEKLSDLAPLHNGSALSVIKACVKALPKSKSIAFFDTVFHRSLPRHVFSYAIDPEIARERGLRKYGFHGLSYSFILGAVGTHFGKSPESLNLVVLHLGSGASACAIQNGKSLDTSMGLTPLHGLPGATRSGSIDGSLIFHYTNKAGRITHDPSMATNIHAEDILNRKAGWKAITGTTDFGEITQKAELDDPDPEISSRNPYRLAFDLFVDRILHYVGSYHLKLHGDVDAIVFAGGIGEKGVQLRETIGDRIGCLGYPSVSTQRNSVVSKSNEVVVEISEDRSSDSNKRAQKILVCKTDEQLEMARQCVFDTRF